MPVPQGSGLSPQNIRFPPRSQNLRRTDALPSVKKAELKSFFEFAFTIR